MGIKGEGNLVNKDDTTSHNKKQPVTEFIPRTKKFTSISTYMTHFTD